MHVGRVEGVGLDQRVDDRSRLERCRRAVQVNERMAVHALAKSGKALPNASNVEWGHGQSATSPSGKRARSSASKRERKDAMLTRSITSRAKPNVIMARAASGASPR